MKLLKYLLIGLLCFSLFFVYQSFNYLDENFNKVSYYDVPVYIDKDVNISNAVYVLEKSKELTTLYETNGLKAIIFLENDKQFRFNKSSHALGWYNIEHKTIYIVYNLNKNNFMLLHTFIHELAHHYDLTIDGNKIDGNQETRAENIVINKMF